MTVICSKGKNSSLKVGWIPNSYPTYSMRLGRKKRVLDLARMSEEAYAREVKMSEGQPVSAAVVKTLGNNQGMFIRNAGHVAEGGGKGGGLGITAQWSRSDHP